ncbi:glycosyltransferase [Lelliottia sp. WAP21]|uniref:glycosyltransferase n=1 Tax=Lelliottia sp. WAP21 TaxID=2877426 RepID=UPI001E31ADEF|nr:glycosyltransferase family 2 protein [Lelliottia sp. WAP21]
MQVNISVVSHGHFKLIKDLGSLDLLSNEQNVDVCIVDNIGEEGFASWCNERNINYIKNDIRHGFGENNNKAFNLFKSKYSSASQGWYFLVLNPDVYISPEQLHLLMKTVQTESITFSCINLFKDADYKVYDNSVRKYPSLLDFLSSFVFANNKTILNKSLIIAPRKVDWASGSFLLFEASLYESLNGFDEGYFMYCEDIDICLRANMLHNCKLTYLPDVKALHLAAHENRKIFSKHFIWHVKSMLRYLMVKNCISMRKNLKKLFSA